MSHISNRTGPVQGTVAMAFQGGASQLIGVIFYMFIARLLPASDIGILSLLIFVSLVLISNLALPSAAVRQIAHSMGKGDYPSARKVMSTTLTVSLCLYGISIIIIFLVARFLSPR